MPCCIRHDESRTRAEGARILLRSQNLCVLCAKVRPGNQHGRRRRTPITYVSIPSGFAASRILAARMRLTSMPARPGQPCKHLPRQVARTSRAKTS